MEQMDFSIELSESEIEKFADYLYQKENAKATINKYMADIKKFLSFLADDKRINKKVLLQYKEWLAQKYAVNSVNSMLAALNQFLEFLNVGKLKVKRICRLAIFRSSSYRPKVALKLRLPVSGPGRTTISPNLSL